VGDVWQDLVVHLDQDVPIGFSIESWDLPE
jgi:hypothetical protein